jgi:hypothetical protein
MFSIYNLNHWFPEIISSTRDIELYSSCRYKWFLQRVLHFYKYAKNVDLEAGGEFAKAHELTRIAFFRENKSIEESVDIGVTHILTKYAETFEREKFQDELKTPNRMAEVFKTMYEQNNLEELTIIPFEMDDGSLSVEQEFVIELPFKHPETNKPLILKCKLDLLGMKDNIAYVLDDKTCKSVLKDHDVQADLLRTQNQFVQYVTVANKCSKMFSNLEVTHVRINRCKIKTKYDKNERIIEPYEFKVDLYFQKMWWNNLLKKVQTMLEAYHEFRREMELFYAPSEEAVIFERAYGTACTAFFKPCPFTSHCTSFMSYDLDKAGYKQVICNSATKGQEVTIPQYRDFILNNTPFPEKQEKILVPEDINVNDFLSSFL